MVVAATVAEEEEEVSSVARRKNTPHEETSRRRERVPAQDFPSSVVSGDSLRANFASRVNIHWRKKTKEVEEE